MTGRRGGAGDGGIAGTGPALPVPGPETLTSRDPETVLDAHSRYVVHSDQLTSLKVAAVRTVIQDAVKQAGANPETVTDN